MPTYPKTPKMQHCYYCGAEMGVYIQHYGDNDTCGKMECAREARRDAMADREEAHEQLDRDMGWSA